MNRQANLERIMMPQLKSTVIPIPLTGRRLALHRGPYKAEDQLMILDDPSGLVNAAINRMDGSHSLDDIAASLQAEQFCVDSVGVQVLVEMLAAKGVVSDVKTLSTAGMSACRLAAGRKA